MWWDTASVNAKLTFKSFLVMGWLLREVKWASGITVCLLNDGQNIGEVFPDAIEA